MRRGVPGSSRVSLIVILLLIVVLSVGLIGASPLALDIFRGSTSHWNRLSAIGQTYGVASAVLSVLAVLGVAVMGSLATVHGPRTGHIATHTTPALDPRPGYLAATAAALTAALLTTWSTSRRAAPDATTPAEPT